MQIRKPKSFQTVRKTDGEITADTEVRVGIGPEQFIKEKK